METNKLYAVVIAVLIVSLIVSNYYYNNNTQTADAKYDELSDNYDELNNTYNELFNETIKILAEYTIEARKSKMSRTDYEECVLDYNELIEKHNEMKSDYKDALERNIDLIKMGKETTEAHLACLHREMYGY